MGRDSGLALAVGARHQTGLLIARNVVQVKQDAFELLARCIINARRLRHFLPSMTQQHFHLTRIQRQIVIGVQQAKLPVVICNPQFAGLKHVAILAAKNRKQNFAVQIGVNGIPIDIKIFRDRRGGTIGQHAAPPMIPLRVGTHVIGNEIDDQSHSLPVECVHQRMKTFFSTQFRANPGKVAGIVATQTSGSRFENRRRVDVADA